MALHTYRHTHTLVHAQAHPVHLHIKSIRCFYERASSKSCFPKVTSRQVINIYIYFCTYTTPHYTSHSLALFLSSSLSRYLSQPVFVWAPKKNLHKILRSINLTTKMLPVNAKKCAHVLVMGVPHKYNHRHTHTLTHMHIPLRFSIIVSK